MNDIADIVEPGAGFDFTKLTLAQPTSTQGGGYFTKLMYNSKPLYIQTPKSFTKQGFVKNGKKIYCDLMFDINDEDFITWIENLEIKCHSLIFEKSDSWFQNSLDMNDIENAFNSLLKSYKSGKKYLIKANVKLNSLTGNPIVKIYNESETQLTIDDVSNETNIISILEIQGIKFTPRNFQIEIELKQTMTLNTDKIFETCVIKKKTSGRKSESESENILHYDVENTDSNENVTESILKDLEQIETNESSEKNIHGDLSNIEIESVNMPNPNETPVSTTTLNEMENLAEKNVDEMIEILPIELTFDKDNLETITLKKPNEVFYKLYKEAREKAKQAKKEAVLAYLEAKNIKKSYMLEDIDSSDESDIEDMESEIEE
jgi:hypothetical protein